MKPGKTEDANPSPKGEGSAVVPPSISLPKGGGAIRGIGEKFAANPVTGTGSMTVPIATSPGRSGFGPQLSLSYDSGSGNGPFGFGWSLSIPAITRKTDKGLPKYCDAENSDVFILSGAEDLVPAFEKDGRGNWVLDPQGNPQIHEEQRDTQGMPTDAPNPNGYLVRHYRPRVEGLFARIERWTHNSDGDVHWRSISRDNILSVYGRDGTSRISDPDDPLRIFSWLICETRDDKGNAVIYNHKAEDGSGVDLAQTNERNRGKADDPRRAVSRYLKGIVYGNQVSLLDDTGRRPCFLTADAIANAKWMFEVLFDYGEGHYTAQPPDAQGQVFARAQIDPPAGSFWPPRLDPFSSYRAGFEMRTYRLCQRVLMFHHFRDELGIDDCLVRSTEFAYQPSPIASFVTSVTQSGYKRQADGSFLKKSLPPLEFTYSQAVLGNQIQEINGDSLENLPVGIDGRQYQWVDLDGEGISGILTEQAGAWYYKANLGQGTFGPLETVAAKPSTAALNGGRQQLLDLSGEGQLDLVDFHGPVSGFYKRTPDGCWEQFRNFLALPNIDWNDPNLRFVDLTGDGFADILITEDEAITWYASLAKQGFDVAQTARTPLDEEEGPRLIFADGTQSIYLADLSGDGLTDLVRIRNGEVCYWPNLGYGKFGKKVTMDHAPWFDHPDLFDQKRIRLADIDGSGTTDILYLAGDGVRVYFNQAGNSWSARQTISPFPRIDDLATVMAMDLLGTGTACLVWSSPLPAAMRRPIRYIDLMAEGKPHLLISTRNNLGAETRVRYDSSTTFYLKDKREGNPWITRLAFPVHVVERVETYDYVSRNRFVTGYAYHHGYFDGVEREFRGFGMVEQWDTEEFVALGDGDAFLSADNIDPASHVPPVLTKTWFHTGAYLEEGRISKYFEGEYYREGDASLGMQGLTDDQLQAMSLPDTILPDTLFLANDNRPAFAPSADEEREACRALKGSILRQEIYALDLKPDGTPTEESDRPYTVSERNYTVECLQPQSGNRYAVFFCHPRETVDFHYERRLYDTVSGKLADPRVTHSMTLETDYYGNTLKSAAIAYGRRLDDPDPVLAANAPGEQKRILVTYTENDFTNEIIDGDAYRTPVASEARTYEIINAKPDSKLPGITNLFQYAELSTKLQAASDGNHEIPYEDLNASRAVDQSPYRRIIERVRTLYRRDDLKALCPLGVLQSLALPGEGFKLAFTAGLLAVLYRRKRQDGIWEDLLPDPSFVLGQAGAEGGGYADLDGDGHWWIPSGRIFYSPVTGDSPATELAYARQHFFLPHRYQDPFFSDQFQSETKVTFDSHDLLMQQTQDALGNLVTAGERDQAGVLQKSGNDYRVLQPWLMTDANLNRSTAAFDALGMVAGTAVMGKAQEPDGKAKGDLLDDHFVADLTQQQIDDFFAKPLDQAAGLLGTATTRIVYDLDLFQRTQEQDPKEPDKWQPVFAATLARETHASDPLPPDGLKIQVNFSYSDGLGREIQKKIQAEPGPLDLDDPKAPTVNPRWVGSGWTIFNNKGKPVRQYEPFFSATHCFEFGMQVGVSPVLFYDPVERVIATLHPNNTFEKVVFDPWQQTSWDVNDTVLLDPRTDPDVSPYTAGYFAAQPATWKTWLQQRIADPQNPPADTHGQTPDQDAAVRTLAHANTPTQAFFDSLGRTFLTVADNGLDRNATPQKYPTQIAFDIEGNQREVTDAKGRAVMRYEYDMLSNRVHQASMEAGERWMLNDVAGKPLYAWDTRGHQFRTVYDRLRRPTGSYLLDSAGPELLIGKTVFGETTSNPEDANLRGKPYQSFDQAGVVTTDTYDFKGNLLSSSRQLAGEYKTTLDWSQNVDLEKEIYSSATSYDALNRPVALTTPHTSATQPSVIRPGYNEANLLEKIEANLRGDAKATAFVTNIDYNPKGQRTRIEYGNGARTDYSYEPATFRLSTLRTDCNLQAADANPGKLQNLAYTYDPAGNITHILDCAQQTNYFKNNRAEPSGDYLYDAIYRLIEARGREHLGQTGGQPNPPTAPDAFNGFHTGLILPGDGKAMGTYIEKYLYDAVGNFLYMQHLGSDPANPGWKRTYSYGQDSQLETGTKSNRLTSTKIGQTTEKYAYDGNEGLHGNITSMPHLPTMRWDYHDQLQATAQQVVNGGIPETTWYVYDAAGQRVRKITESAVSAADVSAGKQPVPVKERTYLAGFEIYREYDSKGGTILERESLHIMDDKRRVALVETKTIDTDPGVPPGTLPETVTRYQFDNHLGSACLELDGDAAVISYEEFLPYGSTSYQAVDKSTKAAAKRYRYTGKERDEENGFYYHGARYYAAWLGRWTACDPLGIVEGPNLYLYARNSPIRHRDLSGTQTEQMELIEGLKVPTVALQGEFAFYDAIGKYVSGKAHSWGLDPSAFVRGHDKTTPHYSSPGGKSQLVGPQTATSNAAQSASERAGAQAIKTRNDALRAQGMEGPLEFVRDSRKDLSAPSRMSHGAVLPAKVRDFARNYSSTAADKVKADYLARNDEAVAALNKAPSPPTQAASTPVQSELPLKTSGQPAATGTKDLVNKAAPGSSGSGGTTASPVPRVSAGAIGGIGRAVVPGVAEGEAVLGSAAIAASSTELTAPLVTPLLTAAEALPVAAGVGVVGAGAGHAVRLGARELGASEGTANTLGFGTAVVTGAALGSFIPGVGTLVGGGIGAIVAGGFYLWSL